MSKTATVSAIELNPAYRTPLNICACFILALGVVAALAVVFVSPTSAPALTEYQYNRLLICFAITCFFGLGLGITYYALSVGHSLRRTFVWTAAMLAAAVTLYIMASGLIVGV